MTRYILTGPMGAGKSTVAAVLGQRLGCEVVDTDDLITAETGRDIQQIFIEEGEAAFRAIERSVVSRVLADDSIQVIALGGGSVLDAQTQQDLQTVASRGGVVAFLDVPAAQASSRVGLGGGRPLLLGNPRATWARLLAERRPVYEGVATVIVDTGDLTPDAVADRIQQENP